MTARTSAGAVSSRYGSQRRSKTRSNPGPSAGSGKRSKRVVESSDSELDAEGSEDPGDDEIDQAASSEADELEGASDQDMDAEEDELADEAPTPKGKESNRGLKIKLKLNTQPAAGGESGSRRAGGQRAAAVAGSKKRRRTDENDGEEAAQEGEEPFSDAPSSEAEVFGMAATVSGTARQRARQDKSLQEELLQLPEESGKKQPELTDLEKDMKREENARRRKLQADQKQENDKTEAINRLLKAHSGRTRSKLSNNISGNASREGSVPLDGKGPDDDLREASTTPTALRFVTSIRNGSFAMSLSLPAETVETSWGSAPRSPYPSRSVAVCGVAHCSLPRKYRSTKQFDGGGCSMEHLKMYESALARGV